MSRVRKCADCGRFCNRLYDVPCNPSCNGIDREVCERCAPHAGAAVENDQPQPQHEITERGRAVVESGLSVRQAHEIETGCSEDNPCANCRRYLRRTRPTPGGHMSEIAQWCLIAAAFALTLPAGVVGGFYAVALAVGA